MRMYLTLCDRCADKMDAWNNQGGTYYLTEVEGSRMETQCTNCFQTRECTQYEAKSKAMVAMEREMHRRQNQERDTRARYKEPFRDW